MRASRLEPRRSLQTLGSLLRLCNRHGKRKDFHKTQVTPRYNQKCGGSSESMLKVLGWDSHPILPVKIDVVIARSDFVAVDAVSASIIGINPVAVRYVQLAHWKELG